MKKGEFICVIGEVGCGKSSLLKAINSEMLFVDKKFIDQDCSEELFIKIANTEILDAPVKIGGSLAYVE